jgi:hypothetical protein
MDNLTTRSVTPTITVRRTPAVTKAFTYPAGCLAASTTASTGGFRSGVLPELAIFRQRILVPLTRALSYPSPRSGATSRVESPQLEQPSLRGTQQTP